MKDNNYFVCCGWMINRLGLSGNELTAYAVLYGFSQDGESLFTGSIKYLSDAIGVSERRTRDVIDRLIAGGHVEKVSSVKNGVTFCEYRVNAEEVANVRGYDETSDGMTNRPTFRTKRPSAHDETSYNNIDDINRDIIEEKEKSEKEKSPKRFIKPTLEEVRTRINEMGYHVDAEAFIAHYESNGWRVGANPMKDWRAALVTWEKKETNKKESYGANSKYTSNTAPRKRVNTDWSKDRSTI